MTKDEISVLGFWDKEKVDGGPNEVLSLVVITIIVNHFVPRILFK